MVGHLYKELYEGKYYLFLVTSLDNISFSDNINIKYLIENPESDYLDTTVTSSWVGCCDFVEYIGIASEVLRVLYV